MKLIKTNLSKRLIIVLIAIMVFNILIPKRVDAGLLDGLADNIGGILFKPTAVYWLSSITNINIHLGVFLRGVTDVTSDIVTGIIQTILSAASSSSIKDGLIAVGSGIQSTIGDIFIGPEDIFSGHVEILNANIFKANGSFTANILDALDPGASIAANIKNVVAKIYVLLRNICALIMLIGLIYTGIRILVSSNIPSKKMQYLMLLEDWIMGMVLLILSHVIMIGVFYLSDALVTIFSTALDDGSSGLCLTLAFKALISASFNEQLINIILYAYLTWLVIVFTISYFKRFFWIVVLTVFAPVCSIMYAFGQQAKQTYTRWLKEYIMTVLIQPFHMIIYYVLVMIPMGITNSDNAFGLFNSDSGLITLIYALVAISFIRPAEKYIRELFGMDKGVAAQGSYDSGIAPIKAAATTAAAIAATVYGGPAAGAAVSTLGKNLTGANGTGASEDGADLPAEDQDDFNATDIATLAANNKQNLSPAGFMSSLRAGSEAGTENLTDAEVAERVGSEGGIAGMLKDAGFSDDEISAYLGTGKGANGAMNASSVIINASNVEMQGSGSKMAMAGDVLAELGEGKENATSSEASGENEDDNVELSEGASKKKRGLPVGKAMRDLGSVRDMLTGKQSIVGTLDDWASNSKLTKPNRVIGGLAEKGLGKLSESNNKYVRKFGETGLGIKDKAKGALEFAKTFEAQGGFTELYKGFNSIRDTMFINGAPQDWKDTAALMEANKKKRDEKAIYNFTNNNENRTYMEAKLKAEAIKKYPNDQTQQQKYVDANLEGKLQSLAQTYAPYGITSARDADEVKQDRKKYGYSTEEAIVQSRKFNAINLNPANIGTIEAKFKLDKSLSSVSDGIPKAKDYFYKSGITDVNSMIQASGVAHELEKKLGNKLSEQMRYDISVAVAKKGNISYNGSDQKTKELFKEINDVLIKNKKESKK